MDIQAKQTDMYKNEETREAIEREIVRFVEDNDEVAILNALVGKFDFLFQDGLMRSPAEIKTIELALDALKSTISWSV